MDATKTRYPSDPDFVQHYASAAKRLRRANVRALGRRQAIKAAKRERREPLPSGLVESARLTPELKEQLADAFRQRESGLVEAAQ